MVNDKYIKIILIFTDRGRYVEKKLLTHRQESYASAIIIRTSMQQARTSRTRTAGPVLLVPGLNLIADSANVVTQHKRLGGSVYGLACLFASVLVMVVGFLREGQGTGRAADKSGVPFVRAEQAGLETGRGAPTRKPGGELRVAPSFFFW